MIPQTQLLVDIAQNKERKLTTKERRQCVVFLMGTDPDMTNTAMAELFDVTEGTIRKDKMDFRRQKAKFIKEDDVGLVIADIALDFERQVRDIERSKAKAKLGSATFLQHCTAAMDLRIKCVKAFQDIGYLPKNLGNMTVSSFDYRTVVTRDGIESRPVNYFDDAVEAEVLALPSADDATETSSTELPQDEQGPSSE
jgi:hypothetical protein